jgi:hypothetical protein
MSESAGSTWLEGSYKCCARRCRQTGRHKFNQKEIDYLKANATDIYASRKKCASELKIRLNVVDSWYHNNKQKEM